MKVGDLVKIKKSVGWRNNALPSTGLIVDISKLRPSHSISVTIHTGEKFFKRDLEVISEGR